MAVRVVVRLELSCREGTRRGERSDCFARSTRTRREDEQRVGRRDGAGLSAAADESQRRRRAGEIRHKSFWRAESQLDQLRALRGARRISRGGGLAEGR